MANIDLGAMTKTDAKILLRCVRDEPKLAHFAQMLEADITEIENAPVAPWRKVVGTSRSLNGRETLECGHVYSLRHSKDWEEDHATRRRCKACLRDEKTAALTPAGKAAP